MQGVCEYKPAYKAEKVCICVRQRQRQRDTGREKGALLK